MEIIRSSGPEGNTVIFDDADYSFRQLNPGDLEAKRGNRFKISSNNSF